MWISKKWLYVNVYALTLNALFLCLTLFKMMPIALPLAVMHSFWWVWSGCPARSSAS